MTKTKLQRWKNLLPRRLYSRISLVFALIIFVLVGVQTLVLYQLWIRGEHERIQRLNWDIASSFARDLLPLIERNESNETISNAIARINDLNPEVDVYILDQRGTIVVPTFRMEHTSVPVELLENILKPQASRKVPIYGPNPRKSDQDQVFSVSRFSWKNQPAYLYAILGGSRSIHYRESILDWYLILGGSITSGIIALFAIALGTTLFFFITRRFSKVTKAVEKISQGNLETRAEVTGLDEVAQLGNQINQMAETIQCSMNTIKEKDRLRRDMVANISHDLRGPVAAINAYLETILDKFEDYSTEKKKEKLEIVKKNINMLANLISQLFELSKLDAKEKKPEFEAFSIMDLVSEEIIPRFEAIANERLILLEAELPEELPRVYGDLQMIYRILCNLIENALRHTSANGRVSIKAEFLEKAVRVSVADTGSGIPEKDLPHIFDRFYIPNSARTKGISGSGIGLAIVKKMLEAHEQEIEVESTEGVGTVFSFKLNSC